MIKINYVGMKCGICNSEFNEHDDVVVCPDCGTPMHRTCYANEPKCPNSDKHADGYVYEEFDKIKKSAQAGGKKAKDSKTSGNKICSFCGEENKSEALFCNFCGARLHSSSVDKETPQSVMMKSFDPLGGVPANTDFEEDVSASDVAFFVGVNTPYYLRVFAALKQKANRFNFSAAIFSGVWFLYRKLYKVGSLILSLNILLYSLRLFFSVKLSMPVIEQLMASVGISTSDISKLTMDEYIAISSAMEQLSLQEQFYFALPTIMFVLQIVIFVLVGLFGNKIYYKHCVEKIKSVKIETTKKSLNEKETVEALSAAGGVNMLVGFIFAALYFVFSFL